MPLLFCLFSILGSVVLFQMLTHPFCYTLVVASGAENCIFSNLPSCVIVSIINLDCQYSRMLSEIIPCLSGAISHQRKRQHEKY